MTPAKWRHLRNGDQREFAINTVLAQINDPKYHGEVNRYRGLSDLQDTLERLMKEAQGRVMEVMKELVNVEVQLNLCKRGWRSATCMRNWIASTALSTQSLYTLATPRSTPPLLKHLGLLGP